MLRREIDHIDDSLLDLVERRVSVSASIAALKRAEDKPRLKMRPRREAEVVDRLMRRARDVRPEMIEHVWRTLMSCGLELQEPLHLVLAGGGDELGMRARSAIQDRVRVRFGPAAELRWATNAGEALDAARATEAVAVIVSRSVPELGGDLVVFEALSLADWTTYAIGRVAAEDVAPQELVR